MHAVERLSAAKGRPNNPQYFATNPSEEKGVVAQPSQPGSRRRSDLLLLVLNALSRVSLSGCRAPNGQAPDAMGITAPLEQSPGGAGRDAAR